MISIVIPIYNSEKTLKRCVDSCLNQTYKDIEIILVDDGSTDNSASICDEYALKDSRIVVIHKQNSGVSSARNFGIKIAKGEYIGFVDSDDWVESHMYSYMYNAMSKKKVDLVACGIIDEINGASIPIVYSPSNVVIEKTDAYKNVLLQKGMHGYLCNKLFKTALITNYLEENILQCEDLLFVVKYLSNIHSCIIIQQTLYHYSRSSIKTYKLSYRQITLIDAYEEILKEYYRCSPVNSTIVEADLLKIYLNFKSRCIMSKDNRKALIERINNGISCHLGIVLNSDISCFKKLNIIFSFFFPKTSIIVKSILKKILSVY